MGMYTPGPSMGEKIGASISALGQGGANVAKMAMQMQQYEREIKLKEEEMDIKRATADQYRMKSAQGRINAYLDKARTYESMPDGKGTGQDFLKTPMVKNQIMKDASTLGMDYDTAIFGWNKPFVQLDNEKNSLMKDINTYQGILGRQSQKPDWADDVFQSLSERLSTAGNDPAVVAGVKKDLDQATKDYISWKQQTDRIRQEGVTKTGPKSLQEQFNEQYTRSKARLAAGEDPNEQTRQILKASGKSDAEIEAIIPKVKISPEEALSSVKKLDSMNKRLDFLMGKAGELKSSGKSDAEIGMELKKYGVTQDELKALANML